jgi:pyruvate ferredoxin oxidoreductase alpha subunit
METVSIIDTQNKKRQVITDPRVMMNEAPRTASFFTGSEVIKEAVKRANVDIMVACAVTMPPEIIVEEIKKAIRRPIRGIGWTRRVNV